MTIKLQLSNKRRSAFYSPNIYSIIALAVLLRSLLPVIGYFHAHTTMIFDDADTHTYVTPARELAAHYRFYSDGSPEIIRTPGYPLLLVPGLLLHHLSLITLAIQVTLSSLTVYLVYLTAKLLFIREHVALVAAIFYAVEPLSILYTSQLLTETLFTTLSTLWLYFFLKYLKSYCLSYLAISAIVLAASVYARPIGYFLPMILAAGLATIALIAPHASRCVHIVHAIIFSVITIGLLIPWQLRNKFETGYSGFSGISAVNMYFYLATSVLAVQQQMPFFQEQRQLGYLNNKVYFARHPEQTSWSLAQRLNFMNSEAHRVLLTNKSTYFWIHLVGIVRVLFDSGATNFLIFFGFYKHGGGLLGNLNDGGIVRTVRAISLQHPLLFWSNALLFPFELVYLLGAAITIFSRRIFEPAIITTTLIVVYYLVISGGPAALGRFKHPAMPIISILAGCGLITIGAWLRSSLERHWLLHVKRSAVNGYSKHEMTLSKPAKN